MESLPLALGEFTLRNRFYERTRLRKRLESHYRSEVLRQLAKILLHTDVAGFVTGQLVSFSGDASYERGRTASRSGPARSLREGMLHGSMGFGMGVVSGLTGLVSAPVRGASEGGVAGFAKGIGRGKSDSGSDRGMSCAAGSRWLPLADPDGFH